MGIDYSKLVGSRMQVGKKATPKNTSPTMSKAKLDKILSIFGSIKETSNKAMFIYFMGKSSDKDLNRVAAKTKTQLETNFKLLPDGREVLIYLNDFTNNSLGRTEALGYVGDGVLEGESEQVSSFILKGIRIHTAKGKDLHPVDLPLTIKTSTFNWLNEGDNFLE